MIDLELDDAIHVGTQGLKRAGQRLAQIAQRELFGQVGATTPTLDRVSRGPNNTLLVKFKGVNMRAAAWAAWHAAGWAWAAWARRWAWAWARADGMGGMMATACGLPRAPANPAGWG